METVYGKTVIVQRLKAVGNSDNAEAIYNWYASNNKLDELLDYLRIKEMLIDERRMNHVPVQSRHDELSYWF